MGEGKRCGQRRAETCFLIIRTAMLQTTCRTFTPASMDKTEVGRLMSPLARRCATQCRSFWKPPSFSVGDIVLACVGIIRVRCYFWIGNWHPLLRCAFYRFIYLIVAGLSGCRRAAAFMAAHEANFGSDQWRAGRSVYTAVPKRCKALNRQPVNLMLYAA